MRGPIALLHAEERDVPLFEDLIRRRAPEGDLRPIVDEALWAETEAAGAVTAAVGERIAAHVRAAARAGARLMICTSAAWGDALDAAGESGGPPLLRIDGPVAEAAITRGGRIGVLLASPTAILPVGLLIERRAALRRVAVTLDLVRVDAEIGNWATGVAQAVSALARRCDVVAVPEPSVAAALPREAYDVCPVLLGPELAVDAAIGLLGAD